MDAIGATLLVVAALGVVILAASRPVTHAPSKRLDQAVGGGLLALAVVLSGVFLF